jgi:hypothetical protein
MSADLIISRSQIKCFHKCIRQPKTNLHEVVVVVDDIVVDVVGVVGVVVEVVVFTVKIIKSSHLIE